MIFQDAGSGFDCHALKAPRIPQSACDLCPSDSALGADLRILGKVEFDTPPAHTAPTANREGLIPKKAGRLTSLALVNGRCLGQRLQQRLVSFTRIRACEAEIRLASGILKRCHPWVIVMLDSAL